MSIRKFCLLLFVLGWSAGQALAAQAAVGTNKANGIYSGNGWTTMGGATHRRHAPAPHYVTRIPATPSATAPMAAEAPVVAQAPAEGRRFSHEPSTAAGAPCPAPATAAPTGEVRRYSYDPGAGATIATAPTPTSARRPTYAHRSAHRAPVNRWQLPKTDARKYTTH